MRDKSFWILAPLSVAASALIAYALVFWTPWFGARGGYGNYDLIETYYTEPFEKKIIELSKLKPEDFQSVVKGLFDDLKVLSEEELYMLSAAGDDVCQSPLISCQGLPGRTARPFIEKALAHKQARQTTAIAGGVLETARFSLAVAIFAMLVSVGSWIVAFLTFKRGPRLPG
jgi:hypothetical protein